MNRWTDFQSVVVAQGGHSARKPTGGLALFIRGFQPNSPEQTQINIKPHREQAWAFHKIRALDLGPCQITICNSVYMLKMNLLRISFQIKSHSRQSSTKVERMLVG